MAKNYTFAEAVSIINEGKDMEAITDIGRRYPILLNKVTKVAALAGESFVDLMSFMPEYLTANKVNTAMKNVGTTGDADEDSNDAGNETDETGDEMPDYESMSTGKLWDILGNAGARKTAKSTKKADLVDACKALWKKQHSGNTEDVDETEVENQYEGKSAMELYKLCKSRGIKAAAKKPAKYYIDLLTAADTEEADDDDWDDDDSEKSNDKKPAVKKDEKKPAKKTTKKEEPSDDGDDGDDDWDI